MLVQQVYVIRHGETAYNAEGRWQGNLQIDLNETGLSQAQALAKNLQNKSISQIYSSDLSRAYQTAQPLADIMALDVIKDKRLQEANMGIFQGLTFAEIDNRYSEILASERADESFVIPNGESRMQVQQRMVDAWHNITQHSQAEIIAIVSHGRAIRMLLLSLFAEQKNFILETPIANTAFTKISYRAGSWHLDELAVTPHLK